MSSIAYTIYRQMKELEKQGYEWVLSDADYEVSRPYLFASRSSSLSVTEYLPSSSVDYVVRLEFRAVPRRGGEST